MLEQTLQYGTKLIYLYIFQHTYLMACYICLFFEKKSANSRFIYVWVEAYYNIFLILLYMHVYSARVHEIRKKNI